MNVYYYNKDTKRYSYEEDVSLPVSPLGEPIVPRGATLLVPPTAQEGHYIAFVDGGWVQIPEYVKSPEQVLKESLEAELKSIDDIFLAETQAPVAVTVPEGSFTLKGGQDSAGIIMQAVQLADLKGETELSLFDINDNEWIFPTASAVAIAVTVATGFRTAFYKNKRDKNAKKIK